MTFQNLLKQRQSQANSDLEAQKQKTAALIAANKAAAARILQDSLRSLESSTPTISSVNRKIWI